MKNFSHVFILKKAVFLFPLRKQIMKLTPSNTNTYFITMNFLFSRFSTIDCSALLRRNLELTEADAILFLTISPN